MKKLIQAAIGMALVTMSASSFAQVYAGFPDIPATGKGFMTSVISYDVGPGVKPSWQAPDYALGEPDTHDAILGRLGSIVLNTAPLSIVSDGTSAADFYVYEGAEYESWDTFVSVDNETWVKVEPVSSAENSVGTVKGYDVDSISPSGKYPYIKLIDTSNSAGDTSSGADIDAVVIASAQYTGGGEIVDTDSRNGEVFNLEKDQATGAVDVKKISKDGSVQHIPFSTDDSIEPIALSVQGNFDCDDAKDINVLATRKADNVPVNIIKDQAGNDIATIDNSVTK